MPISEVNFDNNDSCWTYALKRVGLDPKHFTYETLVESGPYSVINWSRDKAQPGDIVIWSKGGRKDNRVKHLSKEGRVTHKWVYTGFHAGVVEEGEQVSDLTGDFPILFVRFEDIDALEADIIRLPTKIIKTSLPAED